MRRWRGGLVLIGRLWVEKWAVGSAVLDSTYGWLAAWLLGYDGCTEGLACRDWLEEDGLA